MKSGTKTENAQKNVCEGRTHDQPPSKLIYLWQFSVLYCIDARSVYIGKVTKKCIIPLPSPLLWKQNCSTSFHTAVKFLCRVTQQQHGGVWGALKWGPRDVREGINVLSREGSCPFGLCRSLSQTLTQWVKTGRPFGRNGGFHQTPEQGWPESPLGVLSR